MGEAPESSDMPAATSNQHGDAATLDVFAELERAGVPAKQAEKSGSKSKTTKQSRTASEQQGEDAPAAKGELSEKQAEPEVKAAPPTAVAPSTALLFQPPDHASARRPRRASAPAGPPPSAAEDSRSEEHTSELQARGHLVCRLLLQKKRHTRTRSS